MSTRNRRRRSAVQLLNENRAILLAADSDQEEDQPHNTVATDGPDEPDHLEHPDQPAHPDHPDQPAHPDHPDGPDMADGQIDQLALLTQALQLSGRQSFKPPSFNGEGDVEIFLRQFEDVANAYRWTGLERTLHIRGQLQGDAQSCGQGEDYDEITEELRARYGLTRGKARDRLATVQLKATENVHKQAREISRLVAIAFPMLPDGEQRAMALDYYSRAWDSRPVQEHLLAIRPTTLREAARAVEDFLAVHTAGPRPRAHAVDQMASENVTTPQQTEMMVMAEAIKSQTAILQQIVMQLSARQTAPRQEPVRQQTQQQAQPTGCYDCGGPHYRRNCPQRKAAGPSSTQQQGNENGPAQA